MTETLQTIESQTDEPRPRVGENSIVTIVYSGTDETGDFSETETYRVVANRHGAKELSLSSPLGMAINNKSVGDTERVVLSDDNTVLVEIIAIEEA